MVLGHDPRGIYSQTEAMVVILYGIPPWSCFILHHTTPHHHPSSLKDIGKMCNISRSRGLKAVAWVGFWRRERQQKNGTQLRVCTAVGWQRWKEMYNRGQGTEMGLGIE